jgi:hypothetical protein
MALRHLPTFPDAAIFSSSFLASGASFRLPSAPRPCTRSANEISPAAPEQERRYMPGGTLGMEL